MKKITSLLAVMILFAACKKERTCTCEITTSGNVSSHAVSNGLSFSIGNIGLPIPIPPITIVAAKDTNFVTPYSYSSTSKETYDKISKRSIKGTCPSATEESINSTSTDIMPGSYTVTSTNVGTRTGKCSIE